MNGQKALPGECTRKTATLASKSASGFTVPATTPLLPSMVSFPFPSFPLLCSPECDCDTTVRACEEVLVSYLPAGLLPDPVLPPWTEQSLTGPHPCPESCDHVCALPKVQRWPWWTPAFTFSSGESNEKHSGP